MSNSALIIEKIVKRYGRLTALDDVSMSLDPGETLALLGHNGAGKTTLIKLILGLSRPDSGSIEILGRKPADISVRRDWAYLPENVAFHRSLTGREQLTMFARLKGEPVAGVTGILERVGLEAAMDRRIGTYSKGMRQRLGLAQAFIGKPRITILDEPTSGLDPLSRESFYGMISEVAGAGAAVLLSSHALTELEARTDRIVILRQGKVAADGRLHELRTAAGLPIRLRVEARAETVDELARRIGGARTNGCGVELVCDVGDKVQRLSEVTTFAPLIDDIDVVPPSLEDIYRHFSQPTIGDREEGS